MEFYCQGDLCKAIDEQKAPFEEATILRWILTTLEGLEAMHSRDVVMSHPSVLRLTNKAGRCIEI